MLLAHATPALAGWTLIGWNNLGMHCMDGDYSVFSLLPPYNTIYAQLIDSQGTLVRDPAALTVAYEAIADPSGSFNSTSAGKTNFWDHVQSLFGVSLEPDVGLKGLAMPGATNQPQSMSFDASGPWFIAEGIPITPYDDTHQKNTYPLMHLVARDSSGTVLATTDVVLPVSDEMDCTACHASGSSVGAQPSAGWVFDPDPQRDMRLNILRLHDDRQASDPVFTAALTTVGYNPAGLYATVATDGKAILCATCHLSEALSGSGQPGIEPLTQAIHRRMAYVLDPVSGGLLDAATNRSACYRCHPGAVTRCLRGAMGAAVAPDGTLAMRCQSCHGSMIDVASSMRTGWLDEPACQQCHTGTATHNNGEMRYTSVFDAMQQPRVAVDQTFATNPDTPAPGFSLYRFSTGHGGLTCEACHGPTHAEFPSTQRNDNIQSIQHQGHVGLFVECDSCHGTQPVTINGGPHGMHPIGQSWVSRHGDLVGEGGNAAACQACHGSDYRGTVLSRAQASRTLNTEDFGAKQFWRGFQIGCYTCHQGPHNSDRNPNHPPVANDATASTTAGTSVAIPLQATDADGDALALRIVSQPNHGTVGLNVTLATYVPNDGFSGSDAFTFAAWDGSTDSNLATASIAVSPAAPTATSALTSPPLTATPVPCAGDCNSDQQITVDELLTLVNIALGDAALMSCQVGDVNGDGQITIDEVLVAVHNALAGCGGASPTPTGTPILPPSATPTALSAAPTPTFSLASTLPQIETNIFAVSCLGIGCHNATDQAGGQVLEPGQSYAALVGVMPQNAAGAAQGLLRVAPGDPARSFLLTKLTLSSAFDPQFLSRMPLGQLPLPSAQVEAIRAWILRGALANE
ncbi:MAG: Ig-like domain-containing protein [Candidatus Binatia bacterium]